MKYKTVAELVKAQSLEYPNDYMGPDFEGHVVVAYGTNQHPVNLEVRIIALREYAVHESADPITVKKKETH